MIYKDDKKADDKKKRSATPKKKSPSKSRRQKSRSRSKRMKSWEQHRRSKSPRRKKSRSAKRKSRSRSWSRKKKDRSRSRSGKRNRRGNSHKRRNGSSSSARRKKRKRESPSLSKNRKAAKAKVKEPHTEKVKTIDELRAMASGTGIPNYRDLLKQLYQEHNPEKLDSVDMLMEKYVGQEAEMYQRVCRKYGVAPALDGGRHRKLEDSNASVQAFSTTEDLDEKVPPAPAIEDVTKTGVQSNPGNDNAGTQTTTSTNIVLAASSGPAGPQNEDERPVWDWLRGLDNGHGALCRYFDVLRREFDADFSQIAAAKFPTPISPGTLGSIDPSFFEVLGVTSAGHRLLLAKGILALPS